MAQSKVEPAYVQVMEISDMVQKIAKKRRLVYEEYEGNNFQRKTTKDQATTLMIDMEFAQINLGAIGMLTKKAYAFLVVQIMPQLKRYNMLWHHPVSTDGNTKEILAELKRHRMIFRTEVAGIYLVNPIVVWRGTVPATVECTKKLLRENGKRPALEMIRDLKPFEKGSLYEDQELLDKLAGKNYNHDPEEPFKAGRAAGAIR